MNKKSNITYFIVYLIMAVIIVISASVFTIFGNNATTSFFSIGHNLMTSAVSSFSDIKNTTIKNEMVSKVNSAIAKETYNIDLSNNFFKYGWIIFLILTALMIFMFAKIQSTNRGLNLQ